jgi:hypothetical protein
MKMTLFVVVIALALMFDQLKTGGYYRTSALDAIEQAVTRIVRVFW